MGQVSEAERCQPPCFKMQLFAFPRVLILWYCLISACYKSFRGSEALLTCLKLIKLLFSTDLMVFAFGFKTCILHSWKNYLTEIIHFWIVKKKFFLITFLIVRLFWIKLQFFLLSELILTQFKMWKRLNFKAIY